MCPMPSMTNTLGVDNGVSGALCLIHEAGLSVMRLMPIQKGRKGNEIDVKSVNTWLHDHNITPANTVVVIEEPGGSKSAKAGASMAGSFHALRALFVLRGFSLHRVTPQAWQKKMLGKTNGDTKALALTVARQLWPAENWLPTERCSVPHDGLIDAALIGYFGSKNL